MSSAQNHECSTSLLVHAQYYPQVALCILVYSAIYTIFKWLSWLSHSFPAFLHSLTVISEFLVPIAHCTLQSLDSFQYRNNGVCAMCSWDWKLWNVCMTFQFMTLRHNNICYGMICCNFSHVCMYVAPLVCMNSKAVTSSLPQWLQLTVQLSCTATHSQCS